MIGIWVQFISRLFLNCIFIKKQHRLNEKITAPLLRLIDDDENQLGEVSREEALRIAHERGLDLVEVAPLAKPPVCRVMDYGKFIYKQKKLEQKQKKAQRKVEMKTVRLSLRIDEHDLGIKAAKTRDFLEEKNSVKVILMLKGREMEHEDLGMSKVNSFLDKVKDVAAVESPPKRHGSTISMSLIPIKN